MDVGARAEIYRIMRDVAASGVPVVVVSSDAKELEGLCDRVVVFSRRPRRRRAARATTSTEENITSTVVGAVTLRTQEADPTSQSARGSRLRHLVKGDYAPSVILALVILALGAYTFAHNARYLAPFNVSSVLTLLTALAFIAMGQTVVIMTGGIDLSVGPLAGLLVVIASFFLVDGMTPVAIVLAFVMMIVVAAASGLLNGLLVRYGGFTSVAATFDPLHRTARGVAAAAPVPRRLHQHRDHRR